MLRHKFPLMIMLVISLTTTLLADDTPAAKSEAAKESAAPAEEEAKPEAEKPKPKPPPVSKERITGWIVQLNDPDFQVREAACDSLASAGATAAEMVGQAAIDPNSSLETRLRSLSILERMYLSDDDATVDAADKALDMLAQSTNASVSSRADDLLAVNYVVRRKRAVTQLRELGAELKNNNGVIEDLSNPNLFMNTNAYLILRRSWKGGAQGLDLIKRLDGLQMLYVVNGAKVDRNDLANLQRDLTNLRVEERGAAHLGVSGGLDTSDPKNPGCRIAFVKENSAAALAGMESGDKILKFHGQPIDGFQKLIDVIATTEPEQKVEAVIDRHGKTITLQVIMGEW